MARSTHDSFDLDHLRRRMARGLMRLLYGKGAEPSGEPLPRRGIYRILVCHVSHTLGNALLLTPLIQELEATYPGAEIDIVTRSQVGKLLYGHYDRVSQVFQLPAHGFGHPIQWLRATRGMRKAHYDLAIDADPQSQTGRLLLLKARATWTLGFSGRKKSGSVTHAVEVPEHVQNKGQRPVYLLRKALDVGTETDYPVPDLRLDDAELAQGRRMLDQVLASAPADAAHRKVVGVFANATGPKLLGTDWWNPLLAALERLRPDCRLVEIVPMTGRSMLDSRYPSYFSTELRQLGGVLANLDGYLSLDCGIMHLACASRVPTQGIFTTTRADEWGPYGPGNHVIAAYGLAPEAVAQELAAHL
ncbi:glycosyltransferase family 9 protein [Rhodanobacter hydrolyticus]|uniref:Lipopolysaccharide heptosyltransferase family protein n=1 Tax=Rhodanobacter hydrolyticus TaxID=2250595 RepID=A0ABW8J4G4_9GAMM